MGCFGNIDKKLTWINKVTFRFDGIFFDFRRDDIIRQRSIIYAFVATSM